MIYIIAGVIALAVAVWLAAVLRDARILVEKQALHQRRVEDCERERLMAEKMEDTKTYGSDWPGPEAHA